MRRAALLLLAISLCIQPVLGQSPGAGVDSEPVPYEKDEFSPFLRSVHRFEVIFVGSLPLTLFFSGVGFDIGRYLVLQGQGDSNAGLYAPLFFAPPNKPRNTAEENLIVVLTGLGLSFVIALVDQLIDSGRGIEY